MANQKLLTSEQYLTTNHDTVTAWTGLGAALMTLVRQRTVPAAVIPVATITVYLIGLIILHTTTSSLLSLQLFNETTKLTVPTQQYSKIDIDVNNNISDSMDFMLGVPAQALPLTDQLGQSTTLGLHKNTVYDVVQKNNGTGVAVVGAISFTTSCSSLPPKNLSINTMIVPNSDPNQPVHYTELTWQAGNNITCIFDVPYLGMQSSESKNSL
jgi:hypothetical protein